MQIPEYSDDKEWTRTELVKLFSERITEINHALTLANSDQRTLGLTLEINMTLYNDLMKGPSS